MALAGSQQCRAQDPAQGREGRNSDDSRDGVEDWNEDEYGNGQEDINGGGNGSCNGDENRQVEGRESPRTYEGMEEVGRKTRERGRR